MKYFLISLVIIICAAIVYFLMKRNRKYDLAAIESIKTDPNELITINYLPDNSYSDNQLIEIKDERILATIDKVIVDSGKAVEAIKDVGKTYCEVIIPKGAKLVRSNDKSVKNAVRGIYRGEKGIEGHANLVQVEKAEAIASSAMNIASLVVGQYYMSEINNELTALNDHIEQVTKFQTNEYKSKIMSIYSQVKKIASYQTEILENDQLRKDELNNLNRLEEKCTQLLGQANLTIEDLTKNRELDYEQYTSKVKELSEWHMCQGYLLDILENIEKLKYTLYFGDVSLDMCFSQYNAYKTGVEKSQKCLINWHNDIASKLQIEIDSERIKKSGIEKVFSYVPGLFNDEFNYKDLPNSLVSMIKKQSNEESCEHKELLELYNDDLRIVRKDNKVYLLSNNNQ